MFSLTAGALLAGCARTKPRRPPNRRIYRRPAKIVIGLDDNFPPWASAARRTNWSASTSTSPRKRPSASASPSVQADRLERQEAELNGKRVDALWNGLTITEERRKNIGFTQRLHGEPPDHRGARRVGDQDQGRARRQGDRHPGRQQRGRRGAEGPGGLLRRAEEVRRQRHRADGPHHRPPRRGGCSTRSWAATTPPRSRTTTWCSTTTSAPRNTASAPAKTTPRCWLLQKAMDEMKADGSAARISTECGSARTSSSKPAAEIAACAALRRPRVEAAQTQFLRSPPGANVARADAPARLLPAARPASRHGLHPQHPLARLPRARAGHAAALPDHPAAGRAARPGAGAGAHLASASPARQSTPTSG